MSDGAVTTLAHRRAVRAAGQRRLDRPGAGRRRVDRHGALLVAAGGRRDGRDDLGRRVVVDAHRAAAVLLDGRDPVPHAAVRGHVPGPGALARASSGPPPAHEHHRLHDLRRRVGVVRRDLRDDRQDDAAGAEEPRLPGRHHDRHARGRRHARAADPAVDHHDRVRRVGERVDRAAVHRRDPARRPAGGALLRLHRRAGRYSIRTPYPRRPNARRSRRSSTRRGT